MRLLLLALVVDTAFAQSGGFQFATLLPAVPANRFTIADFNLDNRLDFAVASRASGAISIYLQTSEMVFVSAPGSPATLPAPAGDVASGDFNNDGKPDLAISVDGSFTPAETRVWLGVGNGQFTPKTAIGSGSAFAPHVIRAADFNRDGNMDLAVLTWGAVQVLRGDGTGNFVVSPPELFSSAGTDSDHYAGMDVGDIDGDGDTDVAVAWQGPTYTSPFRLLVASNDGRGAFSGSSVSSSAAYCCSREVQLVVADATGDARSEILVNYLAWTGPSALTPQNVMPYAGAYNGFAVADVNFDGIPDWFTAAGSLTVGINSGSSVAPAAPGSPYPFRSLYLGPIAAMDLDGDHKPDVVLRESQGLQILRNRLPYTPAVSSQQIQFPSIADAVVGGPDVRLTATASSGLPVMFSSSTTSVCDVVSKTLVRLSRSGVCTIMARQPGNQNFDPAPSIARSFTVGLSSQTITFAALADRALASETFSVAATTSSGLAVSFSAAPASVCRMAGIVVTLLSVGRCLITASQSGNSSYSAALPVTREFGVTGGPQITSISNAASYVAGRLAPESYGVLFGTGLAPDPAVLLRDASGASRSLELIFAGTTQINFVVPSGVTLGDAALIVRNVSGSAEFPVTIAATAPGLFSANGTGQGLAAAQALIVNADKSVTTLTVADGPIRVLPGTEVYLVLYGTGIRGHGPSVSATIGGRAAEVLFAGPQGSFPGLDQVNLRVPAFPNGIPASAEIRITVDDNTANPVSVQFR